MCMEAFDFNCLCSDPCLIPNGNIMHTDVFLGHGEQQIRQFDVQKQ